MPEAMRSRDWCFTDFGAEIDGVQCYGPEYDDSLMAYLIFQIEETKDGKKHAQGYVEFKKKMSLKMLKEHWDGIHWEARLGSRDQAKAYCQKLESRVVAPVEFGTWARMGARTDIIQLHQDIKDGKQLVDIMDNNMGLALKYVKNIKEVKSIYDDAKRQQLRNLTVEWWRGGTDIGKTTAIYNMGPTYKLNKPQNGNNSLWFDGYEGEDILLIDDYNDKWIDDNFWLCLLDKFPLSLKVKGGARWAKFTRVFITSNEPFDKVYPNTPQHRRRIHKIVELGDKKLY